MPRRLFVLFLHHLSLRRFEVQGPRSFNSVCTLPRSGSVFCRCLLNQTLHDVEVNFGARYDIYLVRPNLFSSPNLVDKLVFIGLLSDIFLELEWMDTNPVRLKIENEPGNRIIMMSCS